MGDVASELRKDPTRARWVLVRPPSAALPSGDGCPFCPGHEHLTPREIQAYRRDGSAPGTPGWSVRVIPEADPYFKIEIDLGREGVGLYDKISPRGATELIIESPHHDASAATLGETQWGDVLWMYGDRIRDLKRDVAIRDILVTRRHRWPGSRISHPFSRVTAIPIIYDDVRHQLTECREYYQYKRRCVYCDLIRQEVAEEDRLVRLTDRLVALVPYAARSPLELWVIPRQHNCAYEAALSADLVPELATMLSGYFRTLAEAMGDPSFEMTLFTSPNQASRVLPGEWATIADDYHWHIEILPGADRLTRVGGICVNEMPPEEAARQLREAWR